MRLAVVSSDGENVDLHLGRGKSIYVYDYDDELSCVYIEEGEIEGVFLLETDEQRINIAFAYVKNNPYVFPYMLGRSFMKAVEKYEGTNPEVTVTVFEETTEKLLQKLVPNAKTVIMTHAQKVIQRT